jgi:hypothetical protein
MSQVVQISKSGLQLEHEGLISAAKIEEDAVEPFEQDVQPGQYHLYTLNYDSSAKKASSLCNRDQVPHPSDVRFRTDSVSQRSSWCSDSLPMMLLAVLQGTRGSPILRIGIRPHRHNFHCPRIHTRRPCSSAGCHWIIPP